MLEKVKKEDTVDGAVLFDVSNIPRDAQYTCVAYVQDGGHKYTKASKPFITLYLRDINGLAIPGYIFDLRDFKSSGLELTQVIHSYAQVTVTENYLPKIGMTVTIEKLSMVTNPTAEMVKVFQGTIGDTQQLYQHLLECIRNSLNINISFPYNICTSSYIDFYAGRVGGQCQHYQDMFDILEVWSRQMSDEEKHQLFSTFVLYVFVHNNYISARESGNDDINLVNTLASAVAKYMDTLKTGSGVSEVIHLFFGYTPKDVFVRMVHLASEMSTRAMNELYTYRSLPISREGDAGYGTIKRYEEGK